jgi:hypothetical protein
MPIYFNPWLLAGGLGLMLLGLGVKIWRANRR